MEKDIYIWSIPIIAQYDETINEEYEELEACILAQNHQHLKFIIFKYNQTTEEACIRIKRKNDFGINFFETIQLGKIDFFGNQHKTLIDFFKEHVYVLIKNKIAAINYKTMLITWGHGAGMGFFYNEKNIEKISMFLGLDNISNVARQKILKSIKSIQLYKSDLSIGDKYIDYDGLFVEYQKHIHGHVDKMTWIEKVKKITRVITAKEFNKIIEKGLGKIDFLLTMNCYMQMFETCLSVRETVAVMISPQTTITFWGYNYSELFKLLGKHPESSEETISKNITCFYSSKYLSKAVKNIDPLNEVSISCIRLSSFDLIDSVDKIADLLKNNLDSEFEVEPDVYRTLCDLIEQARIKCDSPYLAIVDLKHFFNQLIILIENTEGEIRDLLKEKNEEIDNIRHDSLLSIYQPGRLHEPDNSGTSMSPQFISIFFPFKEREALILFKKRYRYGTIMGNTKWGYFLEKINPRIPN